MNDGYEEVRIGPKKVKIPEEWQRVSLESISKNSGQYGANQSAIPFDENEYRYIRVTDLTENGHLSNEEKKSIPKEDNEKYELKNGDIVFARTGTPGLTYVFNENDSNIDYAFAGYLIRFELKDNIDSNYLSYYTQSYHYWSWIKSTQRSTTLSNINASEFRTLPIIKPSSSEQRRIAEILSIVDDAIQKTDEVIEKAERLKKGLMQDLLTKGIGHKEFKEVQIGARNLEIPVEWKIKKLKEITEKFISGGTPSTKKEEYWGGDILWTTNSYMTGPYFSKGKDSITEKGLENSSANIVPKNNLLFGTRVDVGNVAKNTIDMAISQDVTGIVLKDDKVKTDYVLWFLYKNKKLIQQFQQGSTIKGIIKDDVKNFELPIPPLQEQEKIASSIMSIDNKIQTEKSYKEKLKKLKKGLMQDLLIGKVRVNV